MYNMVKNLGLCTVHVHVFLSHLHRKKHLRYTVKSPGECLLQSEIHVYHCGCVTFLLLSSYRAKQALLRLGLYHRQKGQFNDAIHWLEYAQSTSAIQVR